MDEVETGLMEDGTGCGAGCCFEVQVVIEIEKILCQREAFLELNSEAAVWWCRTCGDGWQSAWTS